MPQINDPMLQFCRSAAQSATELATLCLGSMERMQNPQATAPLSEARSESDKTLKQIQSADTLQELYQLQARLFRTQMEKVIGYWASCYSNAHLCQVELMRQTQVKSLDWMDQFSHAMDGARTPEPVVNAMRMMATAARTGYGSILRATEETVQQAVAEAERSVEGAQPAEGANAKGEGNQGSSQAAA